jgi:hypothetical protein
MPTVKTAWVILDNNGGFFNPRNGKFEKEFSITSHIYHDYAKALSTAKAYEAAFVTEVEIVVRVTGNKASVV